MHCFLFFLVILVSLFSGCIPGIYEFEGYRVEVTMPKVEITQTPQILASVYVQTDGGMPTPINTDTSNPYLDVKPSINPPPSIQKNFVIFSVVVPDSLNPVYTNMEILLGEEPQCVIRGSDLDDVFSMTLSNRRLIISPKEVLPTPIQGVTPENKIKRIKGIVAKVVAKAVPTTPSDAKNYVFQKEEKAGVWKFPVRVASFGEREFINSVEFELKTPNFLWIEAGEVFPSPLIYIPRGISPDLAFMVRIENVELNWQQEILLAPSAMPLDLDIISTNDWVEITTADGGKVRFNTAKAESPVTRLPTTWSAIRK